MDMKQNQKYQEKAQRIIYLCRVQHERMAGKTDPQKGICGFAITTTVHKTTYPSDGLPESKIRHDQIAGDPDRQSTPFNVDIGGQNAEQKSALDSQSSAIQKYDLKRSGHIIRNIQKDMQ